MAAAMVAVPQRPSCSGGVAAHDRVVEFVDDAVFVRIGAGRRGDELAHAVRHRRCSTPSGDGRRSAPSQLTISRPKCGWCIGPSGCAAPRPAKPLAVRPRASSAGVVNARSARRAAPYAGRFSVAAFADPIVELVGVEVIVAAVGERRGDAVGELRAARSSRLRSAAPIPHAGDRVHACEAGRRRSRATRSSWCGIWLYMMPPPCAVSSSSGPARTVEEVRVDEVRHHAQRPEVAGCDERRGSCLIAGSKPWLWPTTSTTPLRSAASVIARHSSTVRAIGFSTIACLPWPAAVRHVGGVKLVRASRCRPRRRPGDAHSSAAVA